MIYICIPAHNEERTIGVVLWKIRQVMASFPRDYQILVANDASSDKTADVLAPYLGVLPLSVLHLDRRRGYAGALELLLREAARRADYPKRDVIVTLQADFSDDPEHLTAMLKRVEAGADVVCTNAALPETATRAARWSRKIGQGLLRRRRWPEGVTDPLSGFRAYRVYTVRKAIEQAGGGRLLTWDGSAANVELLTRVLPHARRTDAFETSIRSDRQQRPTRQSFWAIVGPLFKLATGGAGPFHGHPPESVSWATPETRKRRPARRQQGEQPREAREEREVRANGDRNSRRRPERTRRPRPEGAERPRRQRPEGEERPRREGRRRSRPAAPVEQNGNEAPLLEVVPPVAESGEAPRKKKRRRRRRPGANRASVNGGAPTETAQDAVPDEGVEAVAAEGAPTNGERKRRRSRRGRGRRGRRGGSNTNAANGVSTGEGSEPQSENPSARPEPQQPYLETGTD